MGDWFLGDDGKWTYDSNAPSPGGVTPLPALATSARLMTAETESYAEVYEREDGAVYARITPDWFDSYDEVDSTTVADDGGPPDAA